MATGVTYSQRFYLSQGSSGPPRILKDFTPNTPTPRLHQEGIGKSRRRKSARSDAACAATSSDASLAKHLILCPASRRLGIALPVGHRVSLSRAVSASIRLLQPALPAHDGTEMGSHRYEARAGRALGTAQVCTSLAHRFATRSRAPQTRPLPRAPHKHTTRERATPGEVRAPTDRGRKPWGFGRTTSAGDRQKAAGSPQRGDSGKSCLQIAAARWELDDNRCHRDVFSARMAALQAPKRDRLGALKIGCVAKSCHFAHQRRRRLLQPGPAPTTRL